METSIQKHRYVLLHPDDNLVVALQDLKAGEPIRVKGEQFELPAGISAKHKFYLHDMPAGGEAIMYGVLVGKTRDAVRQGEWVNTSNLFHAAEPFAYKAADYAWQPPDVSRFADRTFMGYHRKDGRVGTANYWLFIPTVFCENRNLEVIKETMLEKLGYSVTRKYHAFMEQLLEAYENREPLKIENLQAVQHGKPAARRLFKNVDGIKFLTHEGGCGGTRQDANTLSNLLAAYANHPNVGGITVMGLGCEHLQMQLLVDAIYRQNPGFDKPLILFNQQESTSEADLIQQAIVQTFDGLHEINKAVREPAPLSALTVGVKCGGSDGFSGISANPAVGYCADMLVALGGKVLLAEFPELCGVEQELIDRMGNEAMANKFIRLMEAYEEQAKFTGSSFSMNPSPGNIEDGLITDAIKSAGAARKGGTAPIADVLDYTEPAIKPGLSLVCTPGNDVEATTGKAASGATLILFTTGLGTPTGNAVCPTIKLATNSQLARRMSDIIDIDCGGIITGDKTIEQMGEEILEFCIEVASGNILPRAVQLLQDDFIPWKRGVSL